MIFFYPRKGSMRSGWRTLGRMALVQMPDKSKFLLHKTGRVYKIRSVDISSVVVDHRYDASKRKWHYTGKLRMWSFWAIIYGEDNAVRVAETVSDRTTTSTQFHTAMMLLADEIVGG